MRPIGIDAYGHRFIYDGIPSELFGLSIVFVETQRSNAASGSGFTMETDQLYNAPQAAWLGLKQDQRLEFEVEILCERSMDVMKQTRVKDWLFGGHGFKRLQICQRHQNTFYYNCRLVPSTDYVYGGFEGFRCTVVCDSPYAWEFERIKRIVGKSSFPFNNRSQDADHMYPIVSVKMQKAGSFKMVNEAEPSRPFSFSGLEAGEIVTVDNRNTFINSSTGRIRLDDFSGFFFRFEKGINRVRIEGPYEYIDLQYQSLRRLGGGLV